VPLRDGHVVAVDTAIDAATIFVALARVTEAVYAGSFAGLADDDAVTPVGIVTVQLDPAARDAVLAVRTSVASAPEPVDDGTAVVVPHPSEYVGVPNVLNE
jgi:hypothetical protein